MFSWWLKTFSLINFYSLKTNKINYSNPYFPSCYDWKLQFSQAVHCTRTGRVHIHHRCQIHKYINNFIFDKMKYFLNYFLSDKKFWPDVAAFTRSVRGFIEYSIGDESEILHWTKHVDLPSYRSNIISITSLFQENYFSSLILNKYSINKESNFHEKFCMFLECLKFESPERNGLVVVVVFVFPLRQS